MVASQEVSVAVQAALEAQRDQLGAEGAPAAELEAVEGGLAAMAETAEVQEVGGVLLEVPGVPEARSEEARQEMAGMVAEEVMEAWTKVAMVDEVGLQEEVKALVLTVTEEVAETAQDRAVEVVMAEEMLVV